MLNSSLKLLLGPFLGLALAFSVTSVLAQGGSSGGGGGSGGAGGAGSGAGAGASTGSGAAGMSEPAARSRAARQRGATPSGTAGQTEAPNPALNPALPGQSAVPAPNPGANQSATPGRTSDQGNLNSSQQGQVGAQSTNRGDTPDSTPNNQRQSNSLIDQSQPGQPNTATSGGSSRGEGGASGHDMKSCMDAWDAGTHMTKTQWRRVCADTLSDRRSMLGGKSR